VDFDQLACYTINYDFSLNAESLTTMSVWCLPPLSIFLAYVVLT
jgi:hypothetical protein